MASVINILKGLIGKEDLNIGSGTFLRRTSSGGTQVLNKIDSATFTGWTRVKDYGAVGDGVTDDLGAITAAINAMPEFGVLFFDPGSTYLVTSTVQVNKRCYIVGYGATIMASPELQGSVIQIGTTEELDRFGQDTVWNGVCVGLTVHGNDVAYGVDFVRTNRAHFDSLFILRCLGSAMRFDRANESVWTNITVIDCFDPGDETPLIDFSFDNGSGGDATNNSLFEGCHFVTNGNKIIVNVESPSDVSNPFATRALTFIRCLFHGVSNASNALDPVRLPIHNDLILTKLHNCSGINFFDCRWQLANSTGTAIKLGDGVNQAQRVYLFGGDILEQSNSGTAIDVVNVNGGAGWLSTVISGDLVINDPSQVLEMFTGSKIAVDHSQFSTSRVAYQLENVGATGVSSNESPRLEIKNPNSRQVLMSVLESGSFRQLRFALSAGGSNPETLVFEDDETTVDIHLASVTESLNIGKNARGVRSVSFATLSSEPADRHEGMQVMADRVNWDPLSIGSGSAYPVIYDGTIWRSADGRPRIVSAAPTANANYVGQFAVDTTNDDHYVAVDVGTGASDWRQTNP